MKVAVLGDGPKALSQVLKIREIGGHGVWFNTNPKAFNYFLSQNQDQKSIDSIKSEIQKLKDEKCYSEEPILRVTKRYLYPQEEIPGQSRFADLFRVVVNRQTQETLLKTTENISKEILDSLRKEIEVYFDFDVIVDCSSGVHSNQFIGHLSPVIGELNLKDSDSVKYGFDILDTEFASLKEIVLIGDSSLAAEFILKNQDFIKGNNKIFFWVSHHSDPILELKKDCTLEKQNKLDQIFNWIEIDYNQKKDTYKNDYSKWKELEDYMKAKISEPAYPIPGMVIFSGHSVTAINKLVDQDQTYVSIEKPEFRESLIQKENSELLSKTLSVDKIFVASEFSRDMSLYPSLKIQDHFGLQDEPGVYFYPYTLLDTDFEIEEKKFLDLLFKWFSPKEVH